MQGCATLVEGRRPDSLVASCSVVQLWQMDLYRHTRRSLWNDQVG